MENEDSMINLGEKKTIYAYKGNRIYGNDKKEALK